MPTTVFRLARPGAGLGSQQEGPQGKTEGTLRQAKETGFPQGQPSANGNLSINTQLLALLSVNLFLLVELLVYGLYFLCHQCPPCKYLVFD